MSTDNPMTKPTPGLEQGLTNYSGLARCLRFISRSIASRMNSPRLFCPARTSIWPATSAVRRMVVTTVSELRLSGGRPMRGVVPESVAVVNFSPNIVFAY